MIVYIDVLIVINIYVTYFTLRAAALMLHTRLSLFRLAASSVAGGIMSLAALIPIPVLPSLLLKAALTVLIVLAAFGFGSLRDMILRSALCVTVSMLICGAAALIHEFAGTDFIFSANGYAYMNVSALVLVISSAVIYGVLSLWRRFTDSPADSVRVGLTVTRGDRTAVLSAITDSGCFLRDQFTGSPVILCRAAAADPVLPPNVHAYISGGRMEDISGIRLIPMTTAAGTSLAAAFRPDCVTVKTRGGRKRLDALIAVSREALKNEDFDALISTRLLK
ncbi:MAG: sigma-E processing peptidase SpoIIGA [Ruminiclostridium sp.]|nr:sigma-E processing peptidase SpoIIGA [Ruminiclostridium sp.]